MRSMLTDSPPIARCSRTSEGSYAVFMVLNAVALVFFRGFPQAHGTLFPNTPKPNMVLWAAERPRSCKIMHQATTKNCPQNCSSKILISRCKLDPPLCGPKRFPSSGFFNDVLPYAVFDERREAWRANLLERCAPLVANCTTAAEAAQTLNREFFNLVNVHYNTKRRDQPKPQRIHRTRHGHLHRLVHFARRCLP